MAGDVAVDAGLWLILTAAIALISMGCVLTARPCKPSDVAEGSFDDKQLDRAA